MSVPNAPQVGEAAPDFELPGVRLLREGLAQAFLEDPAARGAG